MKKPLLLALTLALSLPACNTDSSQFEGKLKAGRAAEREAAEKAAATEKAAAEAATAKAKADQRAREEAEKEALADRPEGNTVPTEKIATDDAETEVLTTLEKSGTFEKLAGTLKKDRKKWEPVLRKALRHKSGNVRTQVARILVMNKWRNEANTQALSAALMAEADDIIRENWGYDVRLFLALEPEKGADIKTDLLPAVHKAFTRAKSAGARSNLAETLCLHKYEPALKDIYKVLEETDDTMTKQFMMAALKRFPKPEQKAIAIRFATDPNELVRLRAKELTEAIAMAAQAPVEPATPKKVHSK